MNEWDGDWNRFFFYTDWMQNDKGFYCTDFGNPEELGQKVAIAR